MKFQFRKQKLLSVVPYLLAQLESTDGDKTALLSSTLDSLCALNVTFDMLGPEHQKLLKQRVGECVRLITDESMMGLTQR